MSSYSFSADRPLQSYRKCDTGFLIAIILMWGLGIFTLFVCSQNFASNLTSDPYYFLKRQLICSAVGFVGFLACSLVDMKVLRNLIMGLCVITILLCFMTFIPGFRVDKNGAARWVKLPMNMTFQPSELVKFAIPVFLANNFDKFEKTENPEEKNIMSSVIGVLIFTVIIFLQKDMSTGIFVFGIAVVMFIVSGMKIKWLIPTGILGGVALFIMIFSEEYRLNRLIAFFNRDNPLYADNIDFQSLRAERAISSGGVFGTGIGTDLRRLYSIPEVQSDYIFAGWAEAMGLVGVIIFVAILGFFAFKGFQIACKCKNRFASIASFGIIFSIVAQSLINIGVVCRAFPTTGIPLPFFSLGGSSIMVTLTMCGFVLNASRCDEDGDEDMQILIKDNNYSEVKIEDMYE